MALWACTTWPCMGDATLLCRVAWGHAQAMSGLCAWIDAVTCTKLQVQAYTVQLSKCREGTAAHEPRHTCKRSASGAQTRGSTLQRSQQEAHKFSVKQSAMRRRAMTRQGTAHTTKHYPVAVTHQLPPHACTQVGTCAGRCQTLEKPGPKDSPTGHDHVS